MDSPSAPLHSALSIDSRPILEVRNLQLAFGGRVILPSFSVSVYDGERVFIRGPSGVGKSRLLRAISHLDTFQKGDVLYEGLPLSKIGATAWRRDICYLKDAPTSLSSTPAQLYLRATQFASQRNHARASSSDAQLTISAIIAKLDLDQALLNQEWHSLSAGQKQRMNLAIAVALSPRVLLLDEPTSNLDLASALKFEALARELTCAVVRPPACDQFLLKDHVWDWCHQNEIAFKKVPNAPTILAVPDGWSILTEESPLYVFDATYRWKHDFSVQSKSHASWAPGKPGTPSKRFVLALVLCWVLHPCGRRLRFGELRPA